ncbi:ATP-binding protein [Leptospira sp. 201903075]|uniref:slr1658 superfamily regulator n=1 Tax=Leptospira chreensis TaxID=2810035 RepID=UPI0019662DCE|nr:ATP-binding protein [Leptospira chreensis]MBM9592479.1 ATP-binding protein [Leptospira chreensis]MBM9592687.1 ATP-binding protein [Leptospira chreensis]
MRKYGNFKSANSIKQEPVSKIQIQLKPLDLMRHWRRIGIMSDFIGYFYGFSFLPDIPSDSMDMKNSDIVNSISTVFNELLENAAKYSYDKKADIDISLIHRGKIFEILVQNQSNEQNVIAYETSLKEIFSTNDLESLYLEKLETNENDPQHSGIGLIIVLKDYPVEMEVIIESNGEETTVTNRVIYFTDGFPQ